LLSLIASSLSSLLVACSIATRRKKAEPRKKQLLGRTWTQLQKDASSSGEALGTADSKRTAKKTTCSKQEGGWGCQRFGDEECRGDPDRLVWKRPGPTR